MNKPVCLDLFCRMGGSTFGYQRAGFHVIGVDINPQPGYPGDEFYRADALEFIADTEGNHDYLRNLVDLIHAGPPCQGQNTATASNRIRGIKDDHPSLVVPTRELLDKVGIPYVIEQPTSSVKGTIRRDVTLCMDMFKGELPPPWVQKHRSFELGFWTMPAIIHHPKGRVAGHDGYTSGWRHNVNRPYGPEAPYVQGYGKGGRKATAAQLRHAMGIDWMTGKPTEEENRFDLCEAIPPAYTQWIGAQFLAVRAAAPELIKA